MKIAIIDDQVEISRSLARFLTRIGHDVLSFTSGPDFLISLPDTYYQLVLSDVTMPEMDGYEVMHRILNVHPETAVVLITGFGNVPGAVRAMRMGAFDYLLKPVDMNELLVIVDRVEEYLTLKREHKELTRAFETKVKESTSEIRKRYDQLRQAYIEQTLGKIGVFSDTLRRIFEIAGKFHTDPSIPVLIEGETGTGKEAVAQYIHHGPDFCSRPFVDINCASIAPGLFESELFGYEAGAFTGGKSKGEQGKIELAANGTLFLDEIGELPPDIQAKLLRVLQERRFFRVGGSSRIQTDVRFIGATNANILARVDQGLFREDLFYRFQVGHIVIPPLRERREEILPLAEMFLDSLRTSRKSRFHEFSPQAADLLRQYLWRGNIRELKNTMERIVTLFDADIVQPEHIQAALMLDRRSSSVEISPLSGSAFSLDDHIRDLVRKALQKHEGNKSETARYLGISRDRLYHYLSDRAGNSDTELSDNPTK
jgi:DNA-binding NtrC family response regulator